VSTEQTGETRLAAVQALARLPLYQLSTAGMELFHTNLLYWLATERSAESLPLWQSLGLPEVRADGHDPFIRREWRHIDLVLSPGPDRKALIIENKIGAIPGADQLNGYLAGLQAARPPFSVEAAECVLLTLTPPSFAMPKPWRSVTYRDLLPVLRETAGRLTGSDASLLSAYVEMIGRLDEVATAYDPAAARDAPMALSAEERGFLVQSRLQSLVEKVRAGRFAEVATLALRNEVGDAGAVSSGLTNGSALNDWFVPGPEGRLFGWQVQGGQFRLAVITGPNDPRVRRDREALVKELYEPYFDFTPPEGLVHTLSGYTGKKEWLGFEPAFVYRGASLAPETTWRELLGLATWFTQRTREFVAALHESQ
jgi:hypothetical protein